MSRTIGNLARKAYQIAKKTPMLRRLFAAPVISRLKTAAARWVPPADPSYERWIAARLQARRSKVGTVEQELFSLLTPVWNTPPEYLKALADSVFNQVGDPPWEWILLDNGCTDPATRELLRGMAAADSRIRLFHSETNSGIVAGMRFCLEQATSRYVIAVDHDDQLDRDCLGLVARHLQQCDYPPLLYTDEDHICEGNRILPYFKPDWDPVLFLNSAYTAHVGVMDRRLALQLDVYGERATNSCPDWDAFLRFHQAGHHPVHLPEIVYSWRMHAGSTSANMHSKSDVAASHRSMLTSYIESLQHPERFELLPSPFFDGTPDWWVRRRRIAPRPLLLISLGDDHRNQLRSNARFPFVRETISLPVEAHPSILSDVLARNRDCLVAITDVSLRLPDEEWVWEAMGLLERFPDAGMVGGRVLDQHGRLIDYGRYFNFAEGCVCPDRGRTVNDTGYFHQLWKQRSVDAVSSRFCVCDADFLLNVIMHDLPLEASFQSLGLWAGVSATSIGRRIIASPLMTAYSEGDHNTWTADAERHEFLTAKPRPTTKHNFYSPMLGRDLATAYRPAVFPPPPGNNAVGSNLLRRFQRTAKRAGNRLTQRRRYARWLANHIDERKPRLHEHASLGQFSILTCVYQKTPAKLFRETAASVMAQTSTTFEWVLLVQGPVSAELESIVDSIADDPRVRLIRSIENRGIIGGLRVCLEAATGRYVIPLDSDDLLFPDALQVCAQGVRDNDWPSFLFTDEDHFERGIARDPFRRPGWDPVLNLSGSYIWHLCVFDRNAALELGVYSDTGANWCQDWDTVLRFVRAGHQPVHLPEIVYHWRAHPGSQTNCRQPNPGSLQSQRHVLQQHIDTLPHPERFEIRPCPIDRGSQEWQIVRQPIDMPTVDVIASAESTEDILRSLRSTTAHYIAVVTDGVTPQDEAWIQEAVGLFELHAELSLLTGRIIDETGLVIGGADDEMGADVTDTGPFSLWLKPRCVDRVDPRFFVMRAEVLRQIADKIRGGESLDEFAGQLSEQVANQGNRIAISPWLVAVRCSVKALSASGT